MRKVVGFTFFVAFCSSAAAGTCRFGSWSEYSGTPLLRAEGGAAYVFGTSVAKVDADGAPNAYHPDDIALHCTKGKGFKGLDCPANAGYPKTDWWPSILVRDPARPERAFVQPAGNAFAGYFVSQTSLKDPLKQDTDPAKYVDASTMPYLVFPRSFHRKTGTGTLGDLGYAFNLANGKASPFVVAEIGPSSAPLGEMSIALAEALGGDHPNARTGAGVPKGEIAFVVFPKSGKSHRWPLTKEQLKVQAEALLEQIGGGDGVVTCADAL